MADKAMDVYLNDHLAGAMLGSDLAEQLQKENESTPLGDLMTTIAAQIEEDREALIDLMERMGTSKNPVKQATTWLHRQGESRPKFSGLTSGEPEVGTFMALESLTLGVEGKASLWKALKAVADRYEPLQSTNLDELGERAKTQHDAHTKASASWRKPTHGVQRGLFKTAQCSTRHMLRHAVRLRGLQPRRGGGAGASIRK